MNLTEKILADLASHPDSSAFDITERIGGVKRASVEKVLFSLIASGEVVRVKRTVYRYGLSLTFAVQYEARIRQAVHDEMEKPRKAAHLERLESLVQTLESKRLFNRAATVCLELIDASVTDRQRESYAFLRSRYIRMASGARCTTSIE